MAFFRPPAERSLLGWGASHNCNKRSATSILHKQEASHKDLSESWLNRGIVVLDCYVCSSQRFALHLRFRRKLQGCPGCRTGFGFTVCFEAATVRVTPLLAFEVRRKLPRPFGNGPDLVVDQEVVSRSLLLLVACTHLSPKIITSLHSDDHSTIYTLSNRIRAERGKRLASLCWYYKPHLYLTRMWSSMKLNTLVKLALITRRRFSSRPDRRLPHISVTDLTGCSRISDSNPPWIRMIRPWPWIGQSMATVDANLAS